MTHDAMPIADSDRTDTAWRAGVAARAEFPSGTRWADVVMTLRARWEAESAQGRHGAGWAQVQEAMRAGFEGLEHAAGTATNALLSDLPSIDVVQRDGVRTSQGRHGQALTGEEMAAAARNAPNA